MHVLQLILLGLGLGIGAAVPIGPVNVEIARRTLQRGRPAGMALGFGAVTVDVIFAVGTSLGLSRLISKDTLNGPFGYVGVGVCFLLAAFSLYAGYRAYRHGVDEPSDTPRQDDTAAADNVDSRVLSYEPRLPDTADNANTRAVLAGDFAVGFGMTALNIYTWIWWLLTVPGLSAQHGETSAWDLPIVCVGVFAAASGWVVLFTTIVNRMRRFAGRAWHIGADVVGGVLLLGFGFYALWRLLSRPL